MSNSNFRSLQADYVSGINADRNYIKNGLALQGTAGWVSTRRVIEGVTDGTSETFITSSSANPYSFTAGEPLIAFSNLGGLTNGTTYYARDNASDTTLASSVGGAALNLSTLFNTVAVSPNFFGFYSGNSISTWSVTTSAPLRGDSSFLLTKPASLAVGDAHYYPFTIDNADQARVMQLTFDYSVSGTYVTGDVVVRIRDVTNNRIIQPSGFQVENVGVASEARLTFQTSANSTSYELIFNVASVSTAAYTLKIDNIQLSTQVVPLGAPVTDYTSTTPNWTNLGFSSTSINSLIWWRVGPTLFGRAMFRGSGGSGSASALVLAMPSGLTIDTTKVASTDTTEAVGFYKVYDDVGGAATGMGSVDLNSATNLVFRRNDSATFATSSMTTSDRFTAEFSVPIVGWSSSTVVSSSAETRIVRTSLNRNTNQTGVNTNGTYVKVALDAVLFDAVGGANLGSNRIEIKVPGQYTFNGNLAVSGTNVVANSQNVIVLYKNGSLFRNGSTTYPPASNGFYLTGSWTDNCVVGDYYELYFFGSGNNSVSTLTIIGGANNTNFAATMVQGPSQIAASEVIAFRAKTTGVPTASPGLANTVVSTIIFGTVESDSHGGYNASNGEYRIPAPGFYNIKGVIRPSGTFSSAGVMQPAIYVNGNLLCQFTHEISGGSGNTMSPCAFADGVKLNADDIITFRVIPSSWTTIGFASDPSFHNFSVVRVGGVM